MTRPYDSKYCKYPLPETTNVNTLNWSFEYMKQGGMQLLEMMEKEFPLGWIIENQQKLKIQPQVMQKLVVWLENNAVAGKVNALLKLPGSASGKSFFYKGGGICKKLYKIADTNPIYVNGKFESRYSFVEYGDPIRNGNYLLLPSRANHNYCGDNPEALEKYHFFQELNGKMIPITPQTNLAVYNDLKNALDLMDTLVASL